MVSFLFQRITCYNHYLALCIRHTVAVSCGYDTCFAIKTCYGLYHFIFSIDRVGIPFGLTRSTLALKLSVSPPYYPLGDCHTHVGVIDCNYCKRFRIAKVKVLHLSSLMCHIPSLSCPLFSPKSSKINNILDKT